MLFAKNVFLFFSLSLIGAFAAENLHSPHAETALSPEVLTNDSILALADAGFSDAFIAEKVMISNRTRFDTSVEGLTYLRRNAIGEELIRFIMEHAGRSTFTAAPAVALTALVAPEPVMAKSKTKKAPAPFEASGIAPAPLLAAQPPNASVVSVVNPVVAPVPPGPRLVMGPAATPFMVQPDFYGGWSIGGRPLYNSPPPGYGMSGFAPYGYPVPAVAMVTVSQLSPAPAVSWWR